MKLLKISCFFLGLLVMASCSKEKYTTAIDSDAAPGPVKNVKVEPIPGGALISYDLPADKSLRYVRAEYNIRADFPREAKSSLYSNSLIVDGFPDTEEYEVTLYAVSRGEKSSQPVKVKITPLTSPLQEAFNTLDFAETFGGVTVSFSNSGEASLAVTLLTDSSGRMAEVETYYTKAQEGRHSIRGFANEPRVFGAVIRDRWGNLSDTITATRTPIFEELIPKAKFAALPLPTDVKGGHAGANNTLDKIWDDKIAPNGGQPVLHTAPGSGMPQWFTFDMGELAVLSRLKVVNRGPGASWAYQQGMPKKFEVWGMATQPDPLGGWDGWTKLADFESRKPSGDGPLTNEDIIFATQTGEDFIFEDATPPVRYLRFRIVETWGYVDYTYLTEVTFWGQLQ